jgi:peptidoglycan/LPS O-acetylase OafA/YrhL
MSATIALLQRPPRETSKRRFFLHYLEMLAVMMVSMAVLGGAVWGIFAIFGHSNLRHYGDVRALVMTINMTIGMTIWMRIRGHGWASTAEMDGAMVLPFVLLIGPYWAGVVSAGVFIGVMHLLMLPFMLVVMLRRYDEYAGRHRGHAAHE